MLGLNSKAKLATELVTASLTSSAITVTAFSWVLPSARRAEASDLVLTAMSDPSASAPAADHPLAISLALASACCRI